MAKLLGALAGILILIVLLVAIFPFITQWAWAHSMTPVFGFREISWTEAFAFGVLGSIVKGTSVSSK
jgi:uncharacterized membrane protein